MATTPDKSKKPRPKTGERRARRQTLKIDRLPQAMLDRILRERRPPNCRTWQAIELDSPSWPEWEAVAPDSEVAELFPGRRLPHSNLHRWYDLRIEQVLKQVMVEGERARQIADAFAKREFNDLSESVRNALGEQIFMLLRAGDDQEKVTAALSDLGHLLVKFDRNKIARELLENEKQKVVLLGRKLEMTRTGLKGVRDQVEKKELNPEQLQQKLDEIYGIGA